MAKPKGLRPTRFLCSILDFFVKECKEPFKAYTNTQFPITLPTPPKSLINLALPHREFLLLPEKNVSMF